MITHGKTRDQFADLVSTDTPHRHAPQDKDALRRALVDFLSRFVATALGTLIALVIFGYLLEWRINAALDQAKRETIQHIGKAHK